LNCPNRSPGPCADDRRQRSGRNGCCGRGSRRTSNAELPRAGGATHRAGGLQVANAAADGWIARAGERGADRRTGGDGKGPLERVGDDLRWRQRTAVTDHLQCSGNRAASDLLRMVRLDDDGAVRRACKHRDRRSRALPVRGPSTAACLSSVHALRRAATCNAPRCRVHAKGTLNRRRGTCDRPGVNLLIDVAGALDVELAAG